MAAVLQTPLSLYCVLCTSVHCTVHLYRLVLTRTGPTLSKNWHNITQTRFDQIPPPRHRTTTHRGHNYKLTTHTLKVRPHSAVSTSSPAPAVASGCWLAAFTKCSGDLALAWAGLISAQSFHLQFGSQPSPADTGRSFAKYLHSFALFTTQGYILLVFYRIYVWNFINMCLVQWKRLINITTFWI